MDRKSISGHELSKLNENIQGITDDGEELASILRAVADVDGF